MKVLLFNSIGKILCLMVYSDYSVHISTNQRTHHYFITEFVQLHYVRGSVNIQRILTVLKIHIYKRMPQLFSNNTNNYFLQFQYRQNISNGISIQGV